MTYISLNHHFVYQTALMDCGSLYMLSWEVYVTMDADFCVKDLKSNLA